VQLLAVQQARRVAVDTHKIAHHFCDVCGCSPFSEAPGPEGRLMAAVNARCLDGVDLSAFKVVQWDGRSH
jgi:hypothetical protein